MIQVFNTYLSPYASQFVDEVLKSTFLSEGATVRAFEKKLAEMGILNPVALNSGTAALHLAFVLADIKPGDEVILPAQTFVATGLAILQSGGKPVFADINYKTGNLDPDCVKKKISARTKAICFVDWGGNPSGISTMRELADKHNLLLIEDAAHALGATENQQAVGSIADLTVFSFQAIKHVTTGDGGALAIKHEKLLRRAQKLKWFGIDRDNAEKSFLGERNYDIDEPGYKYHMNNYAAALGLANIDHFAERLQKRRELASFFSEQLENIPGLVMFDKSASAESAWWLFGMHVEKRDAFISAMKHRGIEASVVHQRIDRNSCFGGLNDLPNQEKFDSTQIHIPLHDGITEEQRKHITDSIRKGWG